MRTSVNARQLILQVCNQLVHGVLVPLYSSIRKLTLLHFWAVPCNHLRSHRHRSRGRSCQSPASSRSAVNRLEYSRISHRHLLTTNAVFGTAFRSFNEWRSKRLAISSATRSCSRMLIIVVARNYSYSCGPPSAADTDRLLGERIDGSVTHFMHDMYMPKAVFASLKYSFNVPVKTSASAYVFLTRVEAPSPRDRRSSRNS